MSIENWAKDLKKAGTLNAVDRQLPVALNSINKPCEYAHAALDPNHHHRKLLPFKALFLPFQAASPLYKGADNMRTYNKPEVSTVSRMTSAPLSLTALRRPCFLRPNYACRHSVTPIVSRQIALGLIIG